jgi:hypothetical protein
MTLLAATGSAAASVRSRPIHNARHRAPACKVNSRTPRTARKRANTARCRARAAAARVNARRAAARRNGPASSYSGILASASAADGSHDLHATPISAYAARLTWPAVSTGATVQVTMNGILIDRFPASTNDTYVVRELWPRSSYTFAVKLLSAGGAPAASFTATATTPAARGAFPRLYGASAFVNNPISASPSLDSGSGAMVSSALTTYAGSANLSNDNAWGIPIVSADAQSTGYNVGCLYYWCEDQFGALRIPASAQPNAGSDGHLAVLQPDGSELDMWIGQRSGSSWSAGERWLASTSGSGVNCTRAWGCGAADAAGFALAAGVLRPEEIAQGHIDHALLITTPDTRHGYIACPAISGDGHNGASSALPIGAHVQLDPSINVAALPIPAWQKVIAVALQRYGAYVGDTGGSLEVRAEANLDRGYDAWAKAGVPSDAPSLSDLPWARMRVLSMTQCAS